MAALIRLFLNDLVKKLHNVIFYKILLIFILAMTVPVVSISLLSIRHSAKNIEKQVVQSSLKSLSDKKNILEQKISEVDNLAYQLFSNDDMAKLQRALTFSHQEYMLMRQVIDDCAKAVISNKTVMSIYIFETRNNYVLTNLSKYSKDDFTDQEFLDLVSDKDFQAVRRKLSGVDTVTYIRKLRNPFTGTDIVIGINLDYNRLFNIRGESEGTLDILIFDDNYSEILLESKYLAYVEADTMKSILLSENVASNHLIDDTEFFACKVRSDVLGWNIVYIEPYSNIVQQAALIKNLIITSLLVVLVISLFFAYILSFYIYKPLGSLASKVKEYVAQDSGKVKNAYKAIDEAIIKLFDMNNELMSRYQTAFPYFKKYSLGNFLDNEVFDPAKFNNLLNLLGVQFMYKKYYNVIIDIENTQFTDEIRTLLEDSMRGFKSKISSFVFYIDNNRASAIINTDMGEDCIQAMMTDIINSLKEKGLIITVSIGSPYTDLKEAHYHHKEALAQMDEKFFAGKGKIILKKDRYKLSRKFVYDKKLEEELISCIHEQDIEGVGNLIDRLFDQMVTSHGSIEYIRYVNFHVITNVIYSLNAIGIDASKVGMSVAEIFQNIQRIDTLDGLRSFADETISVCIRLVNEYRKIQHKVIADKIIGYLSSHYSKNISLDDVSRKVFLSPGYLNNIFKSVTGYTVYEYVTKIRMETASDLLINSGGKIQDIAYNVGYNSMQSFLRLFKKYYNMTPNEYRKRFG